MEIQERLKLAQEAGPRYTEIASMFEAAITTDESKLKHFRNHDSASVRFASFVNPLTVPSVSDVDSDPLIKYAAIHNPSTSTEILDHIGLNKAAVNPVIPEVIHTHKNASKEFQVFRAITDFGMMEEEYNEEEERYFFEAIYNPKGVDSGALEALFFLSILNLIHAPEANRELWSEVLNSAVDSKNEVLLKMLSSLPPIPGVRTADGSYVEQWSTGVQVARCIAAEVSNEVSILQSMLWDDVTLNTSYPSEYWNRSRSPRSSLAQNKSIASDLLIELFESEVSEPTNLNKLPSGVMWRLAFNPKTPDSVLEAIVELIEKGAIANEFTQFEILVGHKGDAEAGLITNSSVKGELRKRVEALMLERNLKPEEYEIHEH